MTGIPGMKKHRTLFPTIIMTLAALVLAPAVLAQPGPGGSDGRLRGGGPHAPSWRAYGHWTSARPSANRSGRSPSSTRRPARRSSIASGPRARR